MRAKVGLHAHVLHLHASADGPGELNPLEPPERRYIERRRSHGISGPADSVRLQTGSTRVNLTMVRLGQAQFDYPVKGSNYSHGEKNAWRREWKMSLHIGIVSAKRDIYRV